MTFDGRTKLVVYHRENGLAELFDLQEDPREFENLWQEPGREEFRLQRLRQHMDAVMATVSAGSIAGRRANIQKRGREQGS